MELVFTRFTRLSRKGSIHDAYNTAKDNKNQNQTPEKYGYLRITDGTFHLPIEMAHQILLEQLQSIHNMPILLKSRSASEK